MKIIIVGAGFTGLQLARRLVNGKNDIVLIDNDEEVARHAQDRSDFFVMNADGNNLATLEDAGIADADALVCVTSSDEVNMVTCSLADSVYPKVLKIARVRNYGYYVNTARASERHAGSTKNNRPLYGIDFMVNPDFEAAREIVNSFDRESIAGSLRFAGSNYELIRMDVQAGSRFDGTALKELWKLTKRKFVVAFVESGGRPSLPFGGTVLKAGDCVGMVIERSALPEFLSLCGAPPKNIRKIVLVGAGRIGMLVAERLKNRKMDFIIVDSDAEKARLAEESFPGITFNTDVTDEGFIDEEGVSEYDLVICSTSAYEKNIVNAAYIESFGVENSIVLVSSTTYEDIARHLGIEIAIPVRDTVVDSIMSHLRGSAVSGIHSVDGGRLEIVEITVGEKSKVAGKKLMEISEPGRFLVLLGQARGEQGYSILGGASVISAGCRLVVIATRESVQSIIRKFS